MSFLLGDPTADWRDGRIKQAIIARVLAFRGERPELFVGGDYVPVAVEGPRADHLIAFARVLGTAVAIAVGSRLMARLLPPGDGIRVPPEVWTETRLRLPDAFAAIRLREVLGGGALHGGATIEVGDMLHDLPVALLASR